MEVVVMNYLNVKSFPSNKHFYLTKNGLDDLRDQLNYLRKEKLTLCKRLLGMDTKDKNEYISSTNAYNALEKLDSEVTSIADILQHSDIVKRSKKHSDIKLGSIVGLKSGHKTFVFTLVDSVEANPSANLISDESPLGKALIGKRERSIIRLFTPKGKKLRYKVMSVS